MWVLNLDLGPWVRRFLWLTDSHNFFFICLCFNNSCHSFWCLLGSESVGAQRTWSLLSLTASTLEHLASSTWVIGLCVRWFHRRCEAGNSTVCRAFLTANVWPANGIFCCLCESYYLVQVFVQWDLTLTLLYPSLVAIELGQCVPTHSFLTSVVLRFCIFTSTKLQHWGFLPG